MLRIAAEQFIRPLSGQDHFDLLGRLPGEQQDWNVGWFGDRRAPMRNGVREEIEDGARRHHDLFVIGVEVLCDQTGKGKLGMLALLEARRERGNRRVELLGHQPDDRRQLRPPDRKAPNGASDLNRRRTDSLSSSEKRLTASVIRIGSDGAFAKGGV